jgi:hypothetical protein
MVGDDIKNVVIDKWDDTIWARGTSKINYSENLPVEAVNYGIIFEYNRALNIPANIQAPFGFDGYNTYIIAPTNAKINGLVLQLTTIFDKGSNFTSNVTYSQFFIDVDNIQMLSVWKDKHLKNNNVRRIAQLNCWCPKLSHDAHRIFAPFHNQTLGGNP